MEGHRVRKSQSHGVTTGKVEHSREVFEKQKTRDFTKQNSLIMEEYVEKAGKAHFPEEGEIHYNNTEKWNKTSEAFLKEDRETKAVFLDFDGTMARFTETA